MTDEKANFDCGACMGANMTTFVSLYTLIACAAAIIVVITATRSD